MKIQCSGLSSVLSSTKNQEERTLGSWILYQMTFFFPPAAEHPDKIWAFSCAEGVVVAVE